MKNSFTYWKSVGKQIIIWTLAFSLFNFIREFGHEIVRDVKEVNDFNLSKRIIFQVLLGIVSGLLFGTYAYLFDKYRKRKASFGQLVLSASIGYAFVIVTFIILAFLVFGLFFDAQVNTNTIQNYFASGEAWVLIVYCFIIGFFIEFFKEVDKKFGPGNLSKMLLGKFYKPKEEERIFMFLDMRSSTTIAEQLGHIKYSQLVQDCFRDIKAVIPYQTEVYQYVGDEVVLTWKKDKGLKDGNCVKAYFAFQAYLKSRSEYYISNYNLTPEFKAGLNMGKVTVAEVGEIKREIAYHGDTLNTAARIQARCNEYKQDLLASEKLINALDTTISFYIKEEGKVLLRGKKKDVKIYSINDKNNE